MQFVFVFVATILLASNTSAFSLLGPFEEWQTPALGYNPLGMDVGAPKNLGEEYRWNVPVITYGFDSSFVDYFGNVGITAVDQAFAILNYLPPASQIDLAGYNLDVRRVNFRAEADKIVDIQSAALVLTLEQLGLANPEENVWSLRDREIHASPGLSTTNYYVINRNFDPRTYLPSLFVNETRYTYGIYEFNFPQFADAIESPVDPEHAFSSVTGQMPGFYTSGIFLFWLTQDDAGGLKYLLSTNNINLEVLPDGVTALDGSTNFVNLALRPGVEKLTFQKISDQWYGNPNWSKALAFTDTYLLNGTQHRQELRRTIRRPDIVFSAGDVGTFPNDVPPLLFGRSTPRWTSASGNAQSAGPGTLQGPVTITFAKLGTGYINQFPEFTNESTAINAGLNMPRWGWMTGSIVPVISFPIGFNDGFPSVLRTSQDPENPDLISWDLFGYPNGDYTIESSTDMENWIEFQQVSPPSGTYSFTTSKATNEPVRFFRVTSKAEL